MLRSSFLRTSLVALLASCVLVCPECWVGPLAAAVLGADTQNEFVGVCSCCTHAGPSATLCDDHEHDACEVACLAGDADCHVGFTNHGSSHSSENPAGNSDCICRGAIAPAGSLAKELGSRTLLNVWLALPAKDASWALFANPLAYRWGEMSEGLPHISGRSLRLALGSLLI